MCYNYHGWPYPYTIIFWTWHMRANWCHHRSKKTQEDTTRHVMFRSFCTLPFVPYRFGHLQDRVSMLCPVIKDNSHWGTEKLGSNSQEQLASDIKLCIVLSILVHGWRTRCRVATNFEPRWCLMFVLMRRHFTSRREIAAHGSPVAEQKWHDIITVAQFSRPWKTKLLPPAALQSPWFDNNCSA